MYDNQITKLPASWAVLGDGKTTNGHTNGTNGTNGYLNGSTNGHVDDHPAFPASFLEGKAVRTVYGLIPLKHALDWPMMASYDELAGCASWMGGRIPTADEARSVYDHAVVLKRGEAERKLGKTVPAVNA